MRKMPQIREFMTPAPQTVSADAPLNKVQDLLRLNRVRHLPVLGENGIVGIVSDRSVKSALGVPHSDLLTAQDLMIPNPFSVSPDTELDQVVGEMAEEKYGCALVRDERGALVGIFTTVDACRALRQVLETFYPE